MIKEGTSRHEEERKKMSSVCKKSPKDNRCLGLNMICICFHEYREMHELYDTSKLSPREDVCLFPTCHLEKVTHGGEDC